MSSPWTLRTTRLPFRLWALGTAGEASSSSSLVSGAVSLSSFCRLYVPTTRYSGCAGQNSAQLGGRSNISECSEATGVSSSMFETLC